MIQRIRQFSLAMRAEITTADHEFIKQTLPPPARDLFYAMHRVDQYHALNVTRSAKKIVADRNLTLATEERALLWRCTLLHDVGRRQGDLDVWGKVATVLMRHFLPQLSLKLERDHSDHLWHKLGYALYVQRYHPQIGAQFLRAIGLNQEAAIIIHHHETELPTDSEILKILRAADELN